MAGVSGLWLVKGSGGRWYPFDEHISQRVDVAYQDGEQYCDFQLNGEEYQVDFEAMKQYNLADPTRCRDVRSPSTNAGTVTWQHKGRRYWQDFKGEENDRVEEAFASGSPTVDFKIGGRTYIIDFSSMRQSCADDPTCVRPVRRLEDGDFVGPPAPHPKRRRSFVRPAPSSAAPSSGNEHGPPYWTMGAEAVCAELVPVFQLMFDATYTDRLTKDRGKYGGPAAVPGRLEVVSVTRLQLGEAWAIYWREKQTVGRICSQPGFAPVLPATHRCDLEAHLGRECGECYLMHGAPHAAIQSIRTSGRFDLGRARSAGNMLGQMIYFAENSTKADEYTGDGPLTILVCRVLLGRCHITSDMRPNPASLLEQLRSGYHSIKAHRRGTSGLNEFAIPKAEQAYPEYLVTYNRR